MQRFTSHTGIVAPIKQANIDTDAIIPKQYLKSIKRTGFGVNLFDDWRYLEPGDMDTDHSRRTPNPDFILNQPAYKGASLLITGENFGCGSSREHAPWALLDFGIRVVLAESFGDIFYNNSLKNGLLPIRLKASEISALFDEEIQCQAAGCALSIEIDLQNQTVITAKHCFSFDIDGFNKKSLLEGLDEIELTLQQVADIHAYEARRKAEAPWLFRDPGEHL